MVVDIRHTRRIEGIEVIFCLITQFPAFLFDVLNERLLLRLARNSILRNSRSLYIVKSDLDLIRFPYIRAYFHT